MPDYVPKALTKFNHIPPKRPQHAPNPWSTPVYGQKVQYATKDISKPLDKKGTQRVQAIAGIFLYYGRAVYPTILASLNEISNKQSAPTTLTETACNQLIDYLHAYPKAVLRYYSSNMILCLVSDAEYLVLLNARSRCAIFLHSSINQPPIPPSQHLMVLSVLW